MFRKQLSPAKVKRDDVTFGGGEMLLDYQNSMEVKEELSGCDVSPHLMKPIFLAFCLQPRWFTHRCICWILIPTTTTKTLNGVFVEIPLQEDPGDQTYVTFPIGTSGFYSQVCRSSTTIFRDVKSSHHVASFGTGREGGIFFAAYNSYKLSIHTTLAIIPIPTLFFTWGVDSAIKNTPKKMPQQKHHQPKPKQKNHAGAMPAPSPRKRMSSLIPWILTRRFKGWVSFWESKVPFCPRSKHCKKMEDSNFCYLKN